MKEVFIVAAKRTPIGGFLGTLSGFNAPELGALAIKGAFSSVTIPVSEVDAVYMGNVLAAGLGQSPARQAAIKAGIGYQTDCTTVNKVCAAGMKALMLGAQQIQLNLDQVVVAGGMESMSNVPHYLSARKQVKLGDLDLTDGLLLDGLTDAFHSKHMGEIAEMSVEKYALTREEQDRFALTSYSRAAEATKQGKFDQEIVRITIPGKKGDLLFGEDEDIHKIIPEKVPLLSSAFKENGTITAANASNLNDGAAALILVSKEALEKYNLQPLARIVSYADAALAPEDYATAPSEAIRLALKRAGLAIGDIDFFEINEAYSAVVLANQKLLGFDLTKTNVYGGAVAMGHPLGASGARIICTLLSVLHQEKGKYGMAAICNGGGGASAMIVEAM